MRRPVRTGRRCAAASPAAMPMPVSRTRTTTSVALRSSPSARCGRPPGCTWRRCSAGSPAPGPGGSGRRQQTHRGGGTRRSVRAAGPRSGGGWPRRRARPLAARSTRSLRSCDLAAGDAGHVQQVVHQPGQVLHLPLHHLPVRSMTGRSTAGLLQKVAGVADGGQRVAEFVGQHRQELVLAAVRLGQPLVEPLQLGVLPGQFPSAVKSSLFRRLNSP